MKDRIEYRLDRDGYIENIEFGDSEIQSIRFSSEELEIEAYLPNGSRSIVIKCVQPHFFAATSDHLQNVVERIRIFYPENPMPKNLFHSSLLSEKAYGKLHDKIRGRHTLIVVEPIVGIDIVIACKKVELWENKRAGTS